MMRWMAAGLVAAALAGTAAAQTAPGDTIKKRQEYKAALGADFRIINEGLKGSAPDTGAIAAAGQRMATALKAVNQLYPAGTGPEAGVKTRALAEIWQQGAAFKAAAAATEAETDRFAATAAAGNTEAIKVAFKAMTDSCVACHTKFRGPEEKK